MARRIMYRDQEIVDFDKLANPEITALPVSSGTVTLETNKVYQGTITGDLVITLPTATVGTYNQILVQVTISNTPTISLGVVKYFDKTAPIFSNGTWDIIYEHNGTDWVAGAIETGV